MTKYLVEYSSNNSGGDWWLTDDDWYSLEAAGWKIDWYKDRKNSGFSEMYRDGRFLGALASKASIVKEAKYEDLARAEAMYDWETITGQYPDEIGCTCCGQPHYFYVEEVKE